MSNAYHSVFVARQPVFNEDMSVWGHELLYRHSQQADKAQYVDKDDATMNVAAGLSALPPQYLEVPTRILVNFSAQSINEGVPYALPPEHTVVELEGSARPTKKLLESLAKLKEEGYLLALDGFQGNGTTSPLLDACDLAIVDVLDRGRVELMMILDDLGKRKIKLLAKRVEDQEAFSLAKALDFSMYQGFFFRRPETIPGRKLSAGENARLRVFRIMEKKEPDYDELSAAIKVDAALSYRLLSFLNSPLFGFTRTITSLKQAVILAGWKRVKSWLRVVLLTDMPLKGTTSELPFMSAQRARFLESLALVSGQPEDRADNLFLLGLFSLLNVMMRMEIPDLVPHLPVRDEVKQALSGEDNDCACWLGLATCFEEADWEGLDKNIANLGLDAALVSACYYDSMAWAKAFFESA